MRVTVRTMATPSGLWSASLCGQHAAQAWLVAGGGGLHCELVVLVSYFEPLTDVHFRNSILQALHEVECVLFAIKYSPTTHVLLDMISLNPIAICLELLISLIKEELVSEHLVEADVHINLVVEEDTGVLFHASNY